MAAKHDAIDELIDLVVHVPVGIMLAIKDQLPALAERGRAHTQQQTQLARMFGKFAVDRGVRYVRSQMSPTKPAAAPAAPAADDTSHHEAAVVDIPFVASGSQAEVVPIADYDNLTAPAIISQLTSLTTDELRAVEGRERAGRARRTILGKVTQLVEQRHLAAS